jgi:hypothetical protein
VSRQDREGPLDSPLTVEEAAVKSLAGVGSASGEWWFWNPAACVGHLRVPVTVDENEQVPPGFVVDDAGEEGAWRERTIPSSASL